MFCVFYHTVYMGGKKSAYVSSTTSSVSSVKASASKSALRDFWACFWHGKGTIEEPWSTPEEIMQEPHIKELFEYLDKNVAHDNVKRSE